MTDAAVQATDFLSDPLMNLTQRKGRYGVVYLRALAGQAGASIDESSPGEDVQSIDAKVGFSEGPVYVQVKTTHLHAIDGATTINYIPEVNWLDKWAKLKMPVYFVVVVVPDDSANWLDHIATGTTMTATGAFWVRIDVEAVRDANRVTVPRTQRLTAATLRQWETDLHNAFSGSR